MTPTKRHLIQIVLIALLLITSCETARDRPHSNLSKLPDQKPATEETRPAFEVYFDEYGVVGSFVLYDPQANHWIHVRPERNTVGYIPASTFKIPNSLIALETGVVADAEHVIPWDGAFYAFESWNQDNTLRTAIANSVVWYYQEVARQVGQERMAEYVALADYGNQDISGGIDTFWLSGNLRITPVEQIMFLQGLYEETLPFSAESLKTVKEILIIEETDSYRLSAKTGLGLRVDPQIGWWVGYIERGDEVYYFVINLESEAPPPSFQEARIDIARQILTDLEILD